MEAALIAILENSVAEAMDNYADAVVEGNPGVVKAAFAALVAAERKLDAAIAIRNSRIATRAAVTAYT